MILNRLPEKHEVSEKAKKVGRRVSKRVVLRLLEDRDRKIAQLEAALDKRLRQEYMDKEHEFGGYELTFEEFRKKALAGEIIEELGVVSNDNPEK